MLACVPTLASAALLAHQACAPTITRKVCFLLGTWLPRRLSAMPLQIPIALPSILLATVLLSGCGMARLMEAMLGTNEPNEKIRR
jgi:hypothetical protein